MNNKIALNILPNDALAKCASIVRKYESLPLSVITDCIKNNKHLLEYDAVDYNGLDKIINCYKELLDAGIEAEAYEFDLLVPFEILLNRQKSMAETEEWIESHPAE